MSGQENWKPIPGYEGLYEVSNYGRVKSLERLSSDGARTVPERIRKPNIMKDYHCVCLIKNGKHKVFRVHRLVAECFISPQPTPEHQINHIDGDKSNNYVGNLEWVLPIENTRHAIRMGLKKNPSEETKRKIGDASRKSWENPEYKKKQSERMLATWNNEEKRATLLSHMRGKKRTPEQCARYAAVPKYSRPVLNLDTGELFKSSKAAAEKYHRTPEAIRMAINGGTRSAGYRWRYANEQ